MGELQPDTVAMVSSFDGTSISCQVFGQGPALVMANGVGVGFEGLRLQIEHLRDRFRVVTWDYRGTFASDVPGSAGVGVETQARDALVVMDALRIERAAAFGWSMGVQVGFEAIRQAPDRFTKFACLGGLAGSPFRAAVPVPVLHRVLPPVVQAAARVARYASPVVRSVVRGRFFIPGARLAGYVRPGVDRDVFMAMARGVAGHDHAVYLRTLAGLGAHDATEILPKLGIPVLFIAGGKDHMTPPRTLERLARMAPHGEIRVIPDGSHFALIEAPDEVNAVLSRFYDG